MERIQRLLALIIAACCPPVAAQPPELAHFEHIFDWRVAARTATDGSNAAAVTAGFSAFGRQFDLSLEPNSRIDTASNENRSKARAFVGVLRSHPGSWARIVISADGKPAGMIWDGETLFGVEAGDDAAQATIFRADDLIVPAGTMSCGMHGSVENAAVMFAELQSHEPDIARAAGATLNMGLGLVADAEFTALYPDAANAMLIRANNVDGIFSEQLGVRFSVQQTDVFTDGGTDPFTETALADELLNELAIYRGNTAAQDAQGLTHLFTGRNLEGSTVGIAYVGAVCAQRLSFDPEGRSFGVSLTQANFGQSRAFLESLIAAHEIGHNFGAPHDGEDGACLDAPPGYIMSPSLSESVNSFSQCSIDVMTASLPSATCLTPIANVDVAIGGQTSVSAPLTETQFSYIVTVSNLGLEVASDTSTEINFDAGFAVLAAAPQSGTCGAPQSTLSCDLGEIPAGSSRSIDVTLRADSAGNLDVSGSATNADDSTAANNTFNDVVTIVAASDLALVSSPQTLNLDATTTVTATLENRSGVPATSLTLTGAYSDGVQVSSANFDGDPCTVDGTARTVNCQISSLAGLSDGLLSIALSGVETGSQMLNLSVSALESDPNVANNSANIALEVTGSPAPQPPQTTAEAGGGGGSLGPFALLAMLGGLLRRRRIAAPQNANFS